MLLAFSALSTCLSIAQTMISPKLLTECSAWGSGTTGRFTDCEIRDVKSRWDVLEVEIIKCTIINCGSSSDGGVIRSTASLNIVMRECKILNCHGAYGGVTRVDGGGQLQMASCWVENCIGTGNGGFLNCNIGTFAISTTEFRNISGMSGGVFTVWQGSNENIESSLRDVVFRSCRSSSNGGVLYTNAKCVSPFSITYCRFIACTASSGGGAIYHGSLTNNTIINTCLFQDCQAGSGSAVYFAGSRIQWDRLCFKNCKGNSVIYGITYEGSDMCAELDSIWIPTAKFTVNDLMPRYRISVILCQLHAALL